MPTRIIYQPFINPVKFTKEVPDEVGQYRSKHIDDWQFTDTIHDFEQRVCFSQYWQLNDTIKLQYKSNYAPMTLELYRATDDARMHSVSFSQVRQDYFQPEFFIYEVSLSLQAFAEGEYYFKIKVGSPVNLTLTSELQIFSERIENSLLLEYLHRKFYCDVFFETGFAPSIRIPGIMKPKAPASKDNVYEDQELNMTMLKSQPYCLWTLSIGSSEGIPPWLVKRLNAILGCSSLKIDGRFYTKNEGAKLDENAQEFYPMAGYSIELREMLNRSSVIYEDEVVIEGKMAVVIVADSKGFANQASGSNYFVTDVQ